MELNQSKLWHALGKVFLLKMLKSTSEYKSNRMAKISSSGPDLGLQVSMKLVFDCIVSTTTCLINLYCKGEGCI